MKSLSWGLFWHKDPLEVYTFDNKFWTYINYYRLAIKSAMDLGYECNLFVNKEIEEYFIDLNPNIQIVEKLTRTFYDAINFYILDSSYSNTLILDGDIILKKKLPEIQADVVYEMKETNSWDWLYAKQINKLKKYDLSKIIPEWTGNKYLQIINIGAIQIQNKELRELYLKRWNDLRQFIESNEQDHVWFTAAASQYLLTELVREYNYKAVDLKPFKVYKHYVGTQKFENDLVPYDKLLKFNKESII